MNREYWEAIHKECEALGIPCRYHTGKRNHDRVYVQVSARRERFIVIPKSPSDRRGVDNALSDLRRIMGRRTVKRKSPRRGERRDQCKQEPDPMAGHEPVKREDPFAVLAEHPLANASEDPGNPPKTILERLFGMFRPRIELSEEK